MEKAKSLLSVPLYPFLIALTPAISLYAVNRLELNALSIVRSALICTVIALVAVTISRAVSHSIRGAALLGCILLLSVLAYGYVFQSISLAIEIQIPVRLFLLIWLIMTGGFYVLLACILRRTNSSIRNITIILNIVGATLITAASLQLALGRLPAQPALLTSRTEAQMNNSQFDESLLLPENINQKVKRFPDVYYLILDGYTRGDVLRSRFDFDNSDFLDWLEARGFFVGHLSHSNYPWTHLSLSATLNFEYLQTLLPEEFGSQAPEEYRERSQFFIGNLKRSFVKDSRVHRFFSNLGYRIIANKYKLKRKEAASFFGALSDAMDKFESAMVSPMNDFEETLISNTIVQPFVSRLRSVKKVKVVRDVRISKYDRVIRALEEFGETAKEVGPKFVFYHIMSPHQPFSFDEYGDMVPRHPVYDASAWVEDQIALPGYFSWVRQNYPKNVAGLNVHVRKSIKRILDESDGNAVVIIQADHGSWYGLDPHSSSDTDVVERFGILNAIYFPAEFRRDGLTEDISAVNTFRVVLQNVFEVEISTLENRAFYSTGDLGFEDVTGRLFDAK